MKGKNKMNENIKELLRILEDSGKTHEKEQISLLIEQMEEMNKNYAATLRELETVKTQLKNYSQQGIPITESRQRANLLLMTNEVGDKLAAQHNDLQQDRKSLDEKAKQVVENFKKAGISALNNVCDFLGIKEKLIKYRDIARSNEMTMKTSVEKIETVESELNAAKTHAKNVFRAMSGREIMDAANVKESKFFKRLKAPYLKRQNKYAKRYEKLNRAIAKFDSLENAAHPSNKYSHIDSEKDSSKKETLEKSDSIEKADDSTMEDVIKTSEAENEYSEDEKENQDVKKPKFRAIYYDDNSEPVEVFSDTKDSVYQAVVEAKPYADERDRCYIQKYDEEKDKYQHEGIYLIESGKNVPPVFPKSHKQKHKHGIKTTDKANVNTKNRESVITKLSDNKKIIAARNEERNDKQQEKSEKQHDNAIAR